MIRLHKLVIALSGTPGTGKSTIGRKLAERLNGIYIDLSRLVKEEELWVEIDRERNTLIINENSLVSRIIQIIESSDRPVIIGSHYSEILPPKFVHKVIVLRLNPRVLVERLKARGWPLTKIRENLEAEIIGVCSVNAAQAFGSKFCEVDVTGRNADQVVEEILSIVSGEKICEEPIDWISRLGESILDLLSSLQ